MRQVLTGIDALKALEEAAGQAERSQSSYWSREVRTFSIRADGTLDGASVLGMVSAKRGPFHRLAHWVLQAPFRRMGHRFATLADALALGAEVARRQERAFTYDLLRHCLTLALIRHHVSFDRTDEVSLVVGDGMGMMASLLALAHPGRKVITCNLSKPLLLDLVFLRRAVPGVGVALAADREGLAAALADPSVGVIGVQADNCAALEGAPIGLAVNIVSMQEMNPPVVAEYFRLLRTSAAGRLAFYCCNKLWKRLADGTEVRFADYPWSKADRIVLDEPCRWSQWVYSPRPPFWRYRRGAARVIWHRLAWMALDRGEAE